MIVHNSGQMFAAPKVSRHDSRRDDQLAVEVGTATRQSHLELRSAYSRSAIFLTELASKLKIPRSRYVAVQLNFAVFCVFGVWENQ